MLKGLVRMVLLVGLVAQAKAVGIAIGTGTNSSVGFDNVAVYIAAANRSPCRSGWFYIFAADSDDQTVSWITALAMTSWTTGATVLINGARASANLYSLVSCARVNGLEPYAYLMHLFEELPKAQSVEALEALLPWSVKPILKTGRSANTKEPSSSPTSAGCLAQ